MTSKMPRSNERWLADLRDEEAQAGALTDLRKYLLQVVLLYLDRHHADLAYLERQELEHLAEDFVQQALRQIVARLDTFLGVSKFTTRAYSLVIKIAASELRLHHWRALALATPDSEQEEVSLYAFLSDQEVPDSDTMAVRSQILDVTQQVFNEDLTDRERFALASVYFRDVPVTEVARQLNLNPNNVHDLIYTARKKLKRGLQRNYDEADVLAAFARQTDQ
jgi:RNA polymerase sigma factor (sigma-70 family)